MGDDKTANTTDDHTHIPLPSLAPSIPCPVSDRCATVVPVGASRRSVPDISRIQSHTLPTPEPLTIMCTLVLCCLPCLGRSRASSVTISLSLHRHPFICILFRSRFTCYNKYSKRKKQWTLPLQPRGLPRSCE
jgi:hypothetical protein